jgi:stage V sporulation protein SpoVS
MSRIVGGVLLLLLALPALGADDKPKDKPPTPEEQYQALLKEEADAMTAFREAYEKAQTQEEKDKVFEEKYPKPEKLAPKFLELAQKNPEDPIAVDALIWVVNNGSGRPADTDSPRTKSIAILVRDHAKNNKMAGVCQRLANGYDDADVDLLRGILEKNPSAEVQAEACLALAQRFSAKAQLIQRLKDDPEDAKRYMEAFGRGYVVELLKADAAPIEAESGRLFKDFADKHVGQMKTERVAQLCQRLGQMGSASGETLLRALLEKDGAAEVQGVACLALAQSLKSRAENMPEAQATVADKLRQESERLFQRASDKFADVKLGRGTVGEKAKGELFELRNLAIGKPAPEIEGEDADSKKFKLSDYRGKVVLLDFWGNW